MSCRGEALCLSPLQPGFCRPLQPPCPPPDPLGHQEVPVPCLHQDLLPYVTAGPARRGRLLQGVLSPPPCAAALGRAASPAACRAAPCGAMLRPAVPCHAMLHCVLYCTVPCHTVLVQHPKKGQKNVGQDGQGFGSMSPKPCGCSPVALGLGDTVPGLFPRCSQAPGRILTPLHCIKSGAERCRREQRKCPLLLPGLSLLSQHHVPAAPGQDPDGVQLSAPLYVV